MTESHPLEADHTQTKQLFEKLRASAIRLRTMARDVGAAVSVKEFTSRRYENLVAVYTKKYLVLDGRGRMRSKAEAEVLARNDPEFSTQFETLMKQDTEANQMVYEWKAEEKINDSARSLLSASKGVRNDLMG